MKKLSTMGFVIVGIALIGADNPRPAKPNALSIEALLPKMPAIDVQSTAAQPAAATPMTSIQTMLLFGLVSLAPAAVLMTTAFVRISIVLTLLRQALGSPQIPGNQVLMALALMLTALVMKPVAESVYELGIRPYSEQSLDAKAAFDAGSAPIKSFMIEQIDRTNHTAYLAKLYDQSPHPENTPEPVYCEDYSLAIIAPAYLLSELTTALYIGFAIYLPFLVIDLVVSAVLGAMGLFMLPPSLVSMPLKLILFVLADGWMLVAGMLLRSFA